jgi:hypothetical protein
MFYRFFRAAQNTGKTPSVALDIADILPETGIPVVHSDNYRKAVNVIGKRGILSITERQAKQKQEKNKGNALVNSFFSQIYSADIASVGQVLTHAPQSWHFSGSIQCLPSFSEIASIGQSLTHEPQFTQVSLIL